MRRLKYHQWWIAVTLLSVLTAACSPFGDDSTPAEQVAMPTATGTATFAATPTPSATESHSPTATREPYPGITMVFPDSGCDLTPMTGWRVVDGVPAAWMEGGGVAVGIPGGILYEGDNRLLWRGAGEMQISAVSTDGSSPEIRATPVAGIDVEGHATTSYVTFESPGCWQISIEQGSNRFDATVAIFAEACRPEWFDHEDCPAPPYALYRHPEPSAPAGCDLAAVVGVITGFIDAVNRADVDAALAYFPERDGGTDIDTTGLRWFSLEKMVADDPVALRPLLARLIDGGEQLRLLRLDLSWGWDGGAHFGVEMTRETDELVRYRIEGKGAINCELGQMYLLSAIRQP
jgi:hypothetical protein